MSAKYARHTEEIARTWWFTKAGPRPLLVTEAPFDDPNEFRIVPAGVFARFWDSLRRLIFGVPDGEIVTPRRGLYRHYKGATYQLLGAGWYGRHAVFVYRESCKDAASLWVRPARMWSESAPYGPQRKRFEYASPQ